MPLSQELVTFTRTKTGDDTTGVQNAGNKNVDEITFVGLENVFPFDRGNTFVNRHEHYWAQAKSHVGDNLVRVVDVASHPDWSKIKQRHIERSSPVGHDVTVVGTDLDGCTDPGVDENQKESDREDDTNETDNEETDWKVVERWKIFKKSVLNFLVSGIFL